MSGLRGPGRLGQGAQMPVLQCVPRRPLAMLCDQLAAAALPWMWAWACYTYYREPASLPVAGWLLLSLWGGALLGVVAQYRLQAVLPRLAPGMWVVLLVHLLCVGILGECSFGSANAALQWVGLKQADSGYLGVVFLERRMHLTHTQAIRMVRNSYTTALPDGRPQSAPCIPGIAAWALTGATVILILGRRRRQHAA